MPGALVSQFGICKPRLRNRPRLASSGVASNEKSARAGFYHMTIALTQGVNILLVAREYLLSLTFGADLVTLLRRRLLSLVSAQVLDAAAASS